MKLKTIFFLSALPDLNYSVTAFIMRLSIAVVIWPHGAQMVLGLFGGNGYSGTMGYFTEVMQIPWILAFLVMMAQFVGTICLLIGLFTRLNTLLMLIITLGMIFTSHLEYGFFMNWFGNQAGEGFEYHLLLLGLCAGLLWGGAGKFSLDALIKRTQP